MLVFAACSSSKPTPGTTPAGSSGSTSTPAATPCSLSGGSTLTSTTHPASSATAPVTDVRYSDDGCARIVFTFADHTPGYTIGYAAPPFADCGSGKAVATDGWGADHYLSIRLAPSGGVDLSKSAKPTYTGPRDIAVDGKTLKHLKVICDFEAVFTWIAGLSGKHAFHVETVAKPPRIVIDIGQTPAG